MKFAPSHSLAGFGIALLALTGCDRVELPAATEVALDGYPPAIHAQLEAAVQRVAQRPRRPGANGRLAMLLHTYDQLRGAELYYRRAALLDPGDFRWPYLRSWVLADLGQPDGALESLRAALAVKPDYGRARIRRAELQLATGQLAACRETLDALIRDQPDRPEAYFVRAQLALRQGEPETAIGDLDRVREMTGHFGGLHHSYAQAHRLGGDEASMQRHTRLAEQFKDARADIADPVMAAMLGLNLSTTKRVERARAFAEHGDTARAETILLQALQDDPQSLPLHVTLAGLYGSRGDFAAADRHLELAAAIDPDHPRLHYSTGIARLGEQRFIEAAEAFKRSLQRDPNNPDAWAQLGLLQEIRGDTSGAIASYRQALEHDVWHRQSHWMLGRLLSAAGQHDEALQHLTLLRPVRDPTAAAALLDLGRAYHAAGVTNEAVDVLHEAVDVAAEYGDDTSRAGASSLLRRLETD